MMCMYLTRASRRQISSTINSYYRQSDQREGGGRRRDLTS
jgi:hypothetical protein